MPTYAGCMHNRETVCVWGANICNGTVCMTGGKICQTNVVYMTGPTSVGNADCMAETKSVLEWSVHTDGIFV